MEILTKAGINPNNAMPQINQNNQMAQTQMAQTMNPELIQMNLLMSMLGGSGGGMMGTGGGMSGMGSNSMNSMNIASNAYDDARSAKADKALTPSLWKL
ncbi:MAG: hypothetical protein MZV70_11405 [Desulfobacterales bacterium]|nr:hypothetical protein [Desulfobacterales bacterium]